MFNHYVHRCLYIVHNCNTLLHDLLISHDPMTLNKRSSGDGVLQPWLELLIPSATVGAKMHENHVKCNGRRAPNYGLVAAYLHVYIYLYTHCHYIYVTCNSALFNNPNSSYVCIL